MAEIEPSAGTPGASDPTQVPTAPVAVTPTGPAEGATSGPPPRPKGLLRWGIALLAVAVMVGAVSVAAAFLAAGSSGSVVQDWLPKDTVAYLELRADMPGDQRAKVGDLLAKFPGFADQASLDAKIDEALQRVLEGSGVSWTSDIKPWLGGEVGLAVTSAAFAQSTAPSLAAGDLSVLGLGAAPDDGAVALVAVKDAAAAEAWVGKQVGGTQTTETYAGGEITLVSGVPGGPSMAYAVRDNVLILGPEKTVKAALDTNGSSPVPSSANFAEALKSAPSAYLGFGYLDVAAFTEAATKAAGDQAGLPAACLDRLTGATPAWMAGSARAADDALVFEANAAATEAVDSPVKAGPSEIADRLPASTIAAVEVRDLGPALVTALDTLKEQLSCDPSLAEVADQVDQALSAVGGAEALIGWAGDAAVAAEFADGAANGGLAAVVTDEAAAERGLDQIRALLALGGAGAGLTVTEEPYGDGTLLVVTIPAEAAGMDVPKIAATAQGGVFALGTIDFVKHVVDTDAGTSLAKVDAYERAISLAGGDGVADVYVDIVGLRTAAESMMPAAEKATYETEVKPFLIPFEAFASVVEAPGSTTISRAVITFTQ